MKIVIFTNEYSTRVQYAFKEILRYSPFTDLEWVTQEEDLPEDIPIVNYSLKSIQRTCLHFEPCGLLQNGTNIIAAPEWYDWDDLPSFFKASDKHEGIPFDLPAMVFYLLSRMEEYHLPRKDELGRVLGQESWIGRTGKIDLPLVDLYRIRMQEELKKAFQLDFRHQFPYGWQCTVDIDMAYAYAHRPWYQIIFGGFNELLKGRFISLRDRIRTQLGYQKDPFDTYDDIKKWVGKQKENLIFFFLLADGFGPDKSINPNLPAFKELVQLLQKDYEIGIHPSIASNTNKKKLAREIEQLSAIMNKRVTRSRQHFLQLTIPETYHNLLEHGIKHDHTMGFHDISGYRAGTACPFMWYDLKREQITDLWIHPFYTMDVTLKNYSELKPEAARQMLEKQITFLRSKDLPFVFLWHNSSMSHQMGWQKWVDFPKRMIAFLNSQYSRK